MHADHLGTCDNMAHVSYTGESFSQLILWQKIIHDSSEQESYGSLQQTAAFPPRGKTPRQAQTWEKHETRCSSPPPCNNRLSLHILFSNQFPNLEMSFSAGEWGRFRPLQALNSLYWTVNRNWKLGSARLIDSRPQKPNDVLAERNISKDINNYES